VHKDTVVAASRCVSEVCTFATTTAGLLALADWLTASGCTHVAMEATGVYWKPVWHVLEADFTLVLANAQHIRNVPGRKTDVSDAAWIADLLAHGLIRASFVPPTRIQALRDLTRTRKQLVREVAQHALRIQKVLEDANLKVASVLSDILGKSGRAMLAALLAGETDPERLAALAQGTARRKHAALVEALRGHVTPHHRTLLTLHLQLVDALQVALTELEAAVGKALAPIRPQIRLLTTMPGISDTVAHVVVAEIGVDMTRFPTPAHLASWAGLAPGNNITGGKRGSGKTTKGDTWLTETLALSAWSAARTRDTYLAAQFWRLARRIGKKKAATAVSHSILVICWHLLTNDCDYDDLGGDYFTRRNTDRQRDRLVNQLHTLGYRVTLEQTA
jgi:transposase